MIELTKAEYAVLEYRFQGLQTKEIADRLGISVSAIKNRTTSLMQKTRCQNIAEMTALFGKFEVRMVWVPNQNPPEIIIKTSIKQNKSLTPQQICAKMRNIRLGKQ